MQPLVFSAETFAGPEILWRCLTDPYLMKQWMAEPEVNLEIITDWTPGNSIVMTGFHHVDFENSGIVLEFVPFRCLKYSHRSSISRLTDDQANYSTLEFRLTTQEDRTFVSLSIEGFPTETIRKHLEFYWKTTFLEFILFSENFQIDRHNQGRT